MNQQETALRINEAKEKIAARQKLEWYEREIKTRTNALLSVLLDIQNDKSKPWRFDFATFEEYCTVRLNMTPRRLQQITAAVNLKANLIEDAPEIAEQVNALNEGQARELATIPREQRAAVLRDAIAADKRKLTAAKIREAKAKAIDAETTPEPTTGGDEPCAELPPNSKPTSSAGNAATAVQPDGAAVQTEFEFAIQIEDHDDFEWFLSLTPIERGQAIARARNAQ